MTISLRIIAITIISTIIIVSNINDIILVLVPFTVRGDILIKETVLFVVLRLVAASFFSVLVHTILTIETIVVSSIIAAIS